MAKSRIDTAKRLACHLAMGQLFSMNNAMVHALDTMIRTCGNGLTPQERDYLAKLKSSQFRRGETYRELMWRLKP